MNPPTPSGAGLAKSAGRDYPGGYPDEAVDILATEDGTAAVHNSDNWGDNTHPVVFDMLDEGHGTQRALIAHELREVLQQTFARIETKLPALASAVTDAKDASNKWLAAQVDSLELAQRLHTLGLDRPDPRALAKSLILLAALFVGDWALISVSFQILGLSDTPWVPPFAMTDDLHLAALASVAALVILAHGVGARLRAIEHAFTQRHRTKDAAARSALPGVSWFDILILGVFLALAVTVVVGVGAIRIDYLAAQGVPVQGAPFIGIQLAVLGAAVALTFHYTHPLARKVQEVDKKEKSTAVAYTGCSESVIGLAGAINTDVDLVGTLQAQAGHHTHADRANAQRQQRAYQRRTILSQPEMTTTRLFPAALPVIADLSDADLLRVLVGIQALPEFTKASTAEMVEHHEKSVAAVRTLADRFAQARLADLLPEEQASVQPILAAAPALQAADSSEDAA